MKHNDNFLVVGNVANDIFRSVLDIRGGHTLRSKRIPVLPKTNWTDNMSITKRQNFLLTFLNLLELIGLAMLGALLSLMSFIRESVTQESLDKTEHGSSMRSNMSPSAAKKSRKWLASVNVASPWVRKV